MKDFNSTVTFLAQVKTLVILIVFAGFIGACSSEDGPHQAVEMTKNDGNTSPTGQNGPQGKASYVTFEDVKPILKKYCMSCHFRVDKAKKINWLDYKIAKTFTDNSDVPKNKGKLKSAVKSKWMPMANDPDGVSGEFSQKERNLIITWASNGSYENISSVPEDKLIIVDNKPTPDGGDNNNNNNGNTDPDNGNSPDKEPTLADVKATLLQRCTGCHGEKGTSSGGAPHLAGLSKDYLIRQFKAFSGKYPDVVKREDSDFMTEIINNIVDPGFNLLDPSGDITDEEIKAFTKEKQFEYLAEYFSSQTFNGDKEIELEKLDEDEKSVYEKGKTLSREGACLSCHGNNLYPRISGQDSSYIYSSLSAFSEGTRKNSIMESVIKSLELSDEDMEALALFLSRELDMDSVDLSKLDEKNVADFYKNQCTSCHNQKDNYSKAPSLVGLNKGYVNRQMKHFASEKRKDLILGYMPALAKSLTDTQRDILATYIGKTDRCSEGPATEAASVSKDVLDAGKALFEKKTPGGMNCATCHTAKGSAAYPKIYGQKAEYVFHALQSYRDKTRKSDLMRLRVKDLNDKQLSDLATYISTLKSCDE